MSIQSIHKRYVGIKDSNNIYNFCRALFEFKEFMKVCGWTVTQSGYSGSTSDHNTSSDIIINPQQMNSAVVWFVLKSPNQHQEFLFYRDAYFQTDATCSGLYIGYSESSHFSTIHGINLSVVDESNPPTASDAVWITGYPDQYMDMYNDLMMFPAPPAIARLQDKDLLFASNITSNIVWYFHCIADTSQPFGFYFFNSYYNQTTSVISAEGIFCADPVTQQVGDNDPFVFLCFPNGLNVSREKLHSHTKCIRAW